MIMAEWLILRLPRAPEAPVQWLLTDAQGQPRSQVQAGTLAGAAALAAARHVCVLVPSGDVLMVDVELPVRAGVRLQQVVPYALEEQLAAEIDTQHFAVGPRAPQSTRTMVAVVARALMDDWLTSLRTAGITPEVLCAESGLLPVNPALMVVLLDGDTLCLRRSSGGVPITLSADDISGSIIATVGDAALALEHLIFYVTPAQWQQRSADIEALRAHCASLRPHLLDAGPLTVLATQLPLAHQLNLLQGTYAPQTSYGAELRRWRIAAMLAAALVTLHVGGQALSLWRSHGDERRLDAAIQDIARGIPGEAGTGTVRRRLQQRLTDAQSAASGGGLLRGLGAFARAEGSAGGPVNLEALSFRDGAMDVKLRAPSAESLERMIQVLRHDGWQADLTSGAAAANGYEGRLSMQGGGTK
jgi:general secretion pathway protein L